MEHEPEETADPKAAIADEAAQLRRWMDESPATTPTRERAHEATMRALAKRVSKMTHGHPETRSG